MASDAILLIAFGGPERREEIRPFLDNVLRGRPVPPARVEDVVRHYEAVGGRSPMNECVSRLADGLQRRLKEEGPSVPVYVGMRNWHPLIRDTLARMGKDGVRRAVGVILSPQRNDASWDRYRRDVAAAREALGDAAPDVGFAPGWHAHPRFVEAVAQGLEEALDAVPREGRAAAEIVFTAHSVPVSMPGASAYVRQVETGAGMAASRVGRESFRIAYQSRSGRPSDAWLEPDLLNVIRDASARGVRDLVVVPIGFVCDHVEVLYDLDIEAGGLARSLGIRVSRASTAGSYPPFISMLAEVVRERLEK